MSRIKSRIIGALLLAAGLLLQGCSSVRLAYNTAPQLGWWWVDGYFDFSRDHATQVRGGIDRFFDWHRATQLASYLPLLAAARAEMPESTTAAATCRWQERVREKLEPTLQYALQQASELIPGLGDAQLRALEKRYLKSNDEMRDDYLQPDAARRQAESVKRALERAERLYGRLGDEQQRVLKDGVVASPFNADLWLRERQRRQRETLQVLRRLVADKATADQRLAALRALVVHVERSPDPEYRAYQQKLLDYNCALAARLHNATTPLQRQKARETLQGWEDDIRALSLPA